MAKTHVDEYVVRLVAGQVVVLTVLSLFTQWKFLIFFLAADFAIRAFTEQTSPLAAIGKVIADLLKLELKPIFAPPKRFAALLGFVFSLAVFLLFVFDARYPALVVGGILVFCAVLESVFKVCLGCYAYNWIVAPIINKLHK